MSEHFQRVALAYACVTLLLASAVPAGAQTASEAACRAAIAKQSNGYLKKALKTVTKCHKSRDKGKVALTVDCNDIAEADPASKLTAARSAAVAEIQAGCGAAASLISQYGRCPSPAKTSDDGGATQGIDDFAELGDCLVGLIDRYAEHAGREALGLPASRPTSGLAKCHSEVGKNASKLLVTIGKERARCQAERDSAVQGLPYGCNTSDPSGKIQKAKDKLDSGITSRCNVNDNPQIDAKHEIDALGACGDTPAQLQHCVGDILGLRLGAGLIAAAYELPSTCTAGSVSRRFNAGAGDQLTPTFLSTGWTGTAHIVDVIDQAKDPVTVACDADCANCDVHLLADIADPEDHCRCEGDPTKSCNVINGADVPNCGLPVPPGANTCNCNLGSPLALSSGGIPVCVLNRYVQDHSGTVDLGTGQWEATSFDNAKVYLGENTQLQPCPNCIGDVTPGDGVRDGTCSQGARLNMPCDQTADHPDFGPISHECPPNAITNISGTGLVLTLDFTTGEQSLPAQLPCTTPPGTMCPCLVCSGNTNLGCTSNADCAAGGFGLCNSISGQPSASARANACADGICTCDDDGDGVCDSGTCQAGPTEMFCDGVVRQNGRGFLQCNTVADCAALAAGNCSISQKRPCYPDPLEITGDGTPFGASLSSLFCVPPTTSAAVNNSAGLPSAGAVTLNMDMDALCASDASVVWEPPAGVNCP
jgi:hypothetical protein